MARDVKEDVIKVENEGEVDSGVKVGVDMGAYSLWICNWLNCGWFTVED